MNLVNQILSRAHVNLWSVIQPVRLQEIERMAPRRPEKQAHRRRYLCSVPVEAGPVGLMRGLLILKASFA